MRDSGKIFCIQKCSEGSALPGSVELSGTRATKKPPLFPLLGLAAGFCS